MKLPGRRTVLRVLVAVALIAFLAPFVVYTVPGIVGADHSYVVLSGSMEPTIQTGGVAIVNEQSPATIERGDVITFATKGEEVPTTHRMVEIRRTDQGREFVTKGDANENRDPQPVSSENVIGTLAFSIPYVGYVIKFASTQLGFILLFAVPLGLLVLGEIYDLARAARNSREANDAPDGPDEQAETDGGTDTDKWDGADERADEPKSEDG